jgi:hypothetical protein
MASLLALSRAEQEWAKDVRKRRLWAHVVAFLAAAAALFAPAPWTYTLGAVVAIAEVTAWTLRQWADGLHTRAEEGRRRALVAQGLGRADDDLGAAAVVACFSERARQIASQWEDADYWSSNEPTGPKRLRESLQEGAFWSWHLYDAAAARAFLWLIATALTSGALLVVLLSLGLDATAELVARVLIVALTVAISADVLGDVLAFRSAARVAARTVDRLVPADFSDPGRVAVLVGDYATATAKAPPIPTRVYQDAHDRIDEAWQSHRSSNQSP